MIYGYGLCHLEKQIYAEVEPHGDLGAQHFAYASGHRVNNGNLKGNFF